jgi:hypothetical protein
MSTGGPFPTFLQLVKDLRADADDGLWIDNEVNKAFEELRKCKQ